MSLSILRACCARLNRLIADRHGSTAVTTALGMTALIGFAGLGIDVAVWETTKRDMQGAADQAAYSAAVTSGSGSTYATNGAKAITAQMGFVDGQGGVTVSVNNPPTQGSYTSNSSAWEVIINKPQSMWFAGLLTHASAPTATARAVALPTMGGSYCILVLDSTASPALQLQGNPNLNTPACSIQVNSNSATAVQLNGSGTISANTLSVVGNPGIQTGNASHIYANVSSGASAISDPYAGRTMPARPTPCVAPPSVKVGNTTTYYPGCYSAGINPPSGSIVFSATPAVSGGPYYWIDNTITGFTMGSQVNATANGVTFIMVGNSPVNFAANSNVDFKAPTTGATAGIVFFQDRAATGGGVNGIGGGSQKYTGALYFPNGSINYGGNSSSEYCTQLIAKTVSFGGDSSFQSNCAGIGTATISSTSIVLAE